MRDMHKNNNNRVYSIELVFSNRNFEKIGFKQMRDVDKMDDFLNKPVNEIEDVYYKDEKVEVNDVYYVTEDGLYSEFDESYYKED